MCRNPPRFSDLRTSRRFKHASACCEFAVCCIGAEKQFYKTMLMERKRLILDQSLSLLNRTESSYSKKLHQCMILYQFMLSIVN